MKKYSIGEVSRHLGLSRDTLRFYEKKGMIQPEKQKNGYRSYTYEDIRRLLSIMFYRRLNFSIDDINRILYKGSLHSYRSIIQKKITEEKYQVEQHRQSLIHLRDLQKLYQNVEQSLNCYEIRPMQRHYLMTHNSHINKIGISDLCYIYQEYRFKEQGVNLYDEFFLLSAKTASMMKKEKALAGCPFIQYERCVYTVISSDSPVPEPQVILDAADWAKKQGYDLLGLAYSGFLISCVFHDMAEKEPIESSGRPVHYIELYLPIKSYEESTTANECS